MGFSYNGSSAKTMPLRALREAQGLSLRAVARQADLDAGHLSRVERGVVGLSVNVLVRLAPVLGIRDLEARLRPFVPKGDDHAS